MSQNFAEIAKEITIAAIEKGAIVFPGKGTYASVEELNKYNHMRAQEISKLYKAIALSVNDVMLGNFKVETEQE